MRSCSALQGRLEREPWACATSRTPGRPQYASESTETTSFGHCNERSSHPNSVRPNHVWSYDLVHDRTEDGRQLKVLTLVDEFTRESLCLDVARHIKARDVAAPLAALFVERGAPMYIRSDNGPEFIAKALRQWLDIMGSSTLFNKPGSPWQNAYVESFDGKLSDDLLNLEELTSLAEAKHLAETWRNENHQLRPHRSLGSRTPAEFPATCAASGHAATQSGQPGTQLLVLPPSR